MNKKNHIATFSNQTGKKKKERKTKRSDLFYLLEEVGNYINK